MKIRDSRVKVLLGGCCFRAAADRRHLGLSHSRNISEALPIDISIHPDVQAWLDFVS